MLEDLLRKLACGLLLRGDDAEVLVGVVHHFDVVGRVLLLVVVLSLLRQEKRNNKNTDDEQSANTASRP